MESANKDQSFRKVDLYPPTEEGKKGFVWVLEPWAIQAGGVESTTRYRKPMVQRRSTRIDHPAPRRQRSGAKSGNRTRSRLSKQKRNTTPKPAQTMECYAEPIVKIEAGAQREQGPNNVVELYHDVPRSVESNAYGAQHRPCVPTTSSPILPPPQDPNPYNFEDIIGITNDSGNEPLFHRNFENKGYDNPLLLQWNNISFGKPGHNRIFNNYAM